MTRTLAAAAALSLLAAPLATNAAAATTVVDVGGAQAYVRPDAGAPLAAVQLFVRAGLERETDGQNGMAALAAETILRTPVGGTPLVAAVAARGGSLAYFVSSGYVRFNLQAPPEVLPSLTPLLAGALATPSYAPATLAAARDALRNQISADEKDPRLVGLAMLRASYYRGGTALPPLGTPATLLAFGPNDVKAFHDRWYVRGNTYVAEVGRTGKPTEAASRALIAALPTGNAPVAVVPETRPYAAEPRRLITHRDIMSPYLVLGFAAPSLGDRDFAAALVIRSLLTDAFARPSATTRPAALSGIGTVYGYDVAPAQLALWINGALVDPSTGLGAVSALVRATGDKPLPDPLLNRYKDRARGEWQLESLSLGDRAWSIGNAVSQGLDPDAGDAVAAAIAQVTPADVQRVAKRYFAKFDVALILPRPQGQGG